jgi:protein-S-isoprenylcysteine O-methyltransferase Ste14
VTVPLLVRTLTAFLMPLTVGFLVPLWLLSTDDAARTFHVIGLLPITVGTGLLLWCVRDFHVIGRGTIGPWDPPRHLVVVGPYRWSRNPMYAGVSLVLLGWVTAFRSGELLIYTLIVMSAFQVRVVGFEEPWLARTHGEQWQRYKARVPRWLSLKRTSASVVP